MSVLVAQWLHPVGVPQVTASVDSRGELTIILSLVPCSSQPVNTVYLKYSKEKSSLFSLITINLVDYFTVRRSVHLPI